MINSLQKPPFSFWMISIIFLLWNLMGITSFFFHTTITEEAIALLPVNEQALYGEYPLWTDLVFSIAVFGGLIGVLALLLRKKWALYPFIISLLAVIPQMIHNVFLTSAIEVYGAFQAALMPSLVFILAVVQIVYAKRADGNNWLA